MCVCLEEEEELSSNLKLKKTNEKNNYCRHYGKQHVKSSNLEFQ